MENILWANAWLPNIQGLELRLILIVLASYPIAYRYYQAYIINDAPPDARNQYILFTGLGLSLLLNRWNTIHSLITICTTYYLCYLSLQYHYYRSLGVMAVWLFNACYLMASTLLFEPSYWRVTQGVLCLRLMSFSFDLLSLPRDHHDNRVIKKLPELQYLVGYCYFPSAFLMGPPFPYVLYQRMLLFSNKKKEFLDDMGKVQDAHATRCVVVAFAYFATCFVFSRFSTGYLLTDHYASLSFLHRLFAFLLSGRLIFMKYIGLWLLAEGANTYFSISYTGLDRNGEPNFEGLSNIKLFKFESNRSSMERTYNLNIHQWFDYYCVRKGNWFHRLVFIVLLWMQNPWLCLSLSGLHQVEKVISCRNTSVNKCLSWICTHIYLYYGMVGFDSHLLYPTVYCALHLLIIAVMLFKYYNNK